MSEQDDQEFADFVVAVRHRLLRVADLLCGDRGRAEDLVQHALVKTYLAWSRLRSGNPEAYARTVITHANIDWWRRRPWRERSTPSPPEQTDRADHAAEFTQRDAVLRALGALTPRERAVIALRYYCDLSEAEIARETGIAAGTVKSTSARALAKLRASAQLRDEVGRR